MMSNGSLKIQFFTNGFNTIGDKGQALVPSLKISNLHVYSLICQCKGDCGIKNGASSGGGVGSLMA